MEVRAKAAEEKWRRFGVEIDICPKDHK